MNNTNLPPSFLSPEQGSLRGLGDPRRSILFIMHMPPPMHGAAKVGQYIADSSFLDCFIEKHVVNLAIAGSLEKVGKFSFGKVIAFFKLLWHIYREVKRVRPSAVYITPNAAGGAFFKEFVIVQMLKKLMPRPVTKDGKTKGEYPIIAHYHNKGVSTHQHKKVYNWCYKRFFNGLNVVLLAETLYDDVKNYVKETNVQYLPNGIAETNKGLMPVRNNPCPQMLFLSNMFVEKGVLDLLDACKILKDKGLDFGCTFIGGETAEMDGVRFNDEMKKRGLERFVQYLGPKSGDDVTNAYVQSDIFVFPTYYHRECFPLVLLEAMEQALPCVSTKEAGIPGIIIDGKTGFLVDKKDPKALAEKLELLICDDALRKEMGRAGKERFENEFTLVKFEHNLLNVLNQWI